MFLNVAISNYFQLSLSMHLIYSLIVSRAILVLYLYRLDSILKWSMWACSEQKFLWCYPHLTRPHEDYCLRLYIVFLLPSALPLPTLSLSLSLAPSPTHFLYPILSFYSSQHETSVRKKLGSRREERVSVFIIQEIFAKNASTRIQNASLTINLRI